MKKVTSLITLTALFICLNAMAAFSYSINYNYALNGTEFTSPYSASLADFQLESFNNASLGKVPQTGLGWNWSGNAKVVNGTVDGQFAAPFGIGAADRSNFISVPNPVSNGSVTVTLPGLFNYFGLWWGSVDSYNSISFYNGTQRVASFTGTQATSPSAANGNQVAPSSNLYVNFLDLPVFDRFVMSSTSYAFEADNIAVGNVVPEPGTMMLFGIGMLGLAIFGKRRMGRRS